LGSTCLIRALKQNQLRLIYTTHSTVQHTYTSLKNNVKRTNSRVCIIVYVCESSEGITNCHVSRYAFVPPFYSSPLTRSLSSSMHSQCDCSPPSFGITESPLGHNREPGKNTHTRENKGRRERTCLTNNVEERRDGEQKMEMQGRVREKQGSVSQSSEVIAVHLRGLVLLTFLDTSN